MPQTTPSVPSTAASSASAPAPEDAHPMDFDRPSEAPPPETTEVSGEGDEEEKGRGGGAGGGAPPAAGGGGAGAAESSSSAPAAVAPAGGGGGETSSTSSGSDPLADDVSSDSSDLSDDDDDDDDDDKATPPAADPTSVLTEAMSLKEEGNAAFKSNDLTSAARLYRKGATALKPLNRGNSGDEQVKALLLVLHTNLSTVCFKQGKAKMSRDVATKALEVDGNHVKALFRRAAAHRRLGEDEEARKDLRAALRVDPNNAAVKRELVGLRKEMEDKKKAEKERLKKAFGGKTGGSFLYEDKEEEERRKAEEKRRKAEREKEAKEERKKEWEDECVRRMANDEEAIGFEDWDKERKRREEEEEKERKKKRKEEEERRRAERKAAREKARLERKGAGSKDAGDGSSDEDDDHGLTKSELESLRGYKKTADGRTTSYFTRELSAEQRAMIGDIAPQRLDSSPPAAARPSSATNAPATTAAAAPAPVVPGSAAGPAAGSATTASAWNRAGTWEEKDTSDWCAGCLRRHLSASSVSLAEAEEGVGGGGGGEGGATNDGAGGVYVARVTEVKDLSGDASVALAGGRKRYIFDYRASVRYDVVLVTPPRTAAAASDGDAAGGEEEPPSDASAEAEAAAAAAKPEERVVASALLHLPDVNSGAAHEVEVDVPGTWKKAPAEGHGGAARACRERLVEEVRGKVAEFVSEFNARY